MRFSIQLSVGGGHKLYSSLYEGRLLSTCKSIHNFAVDSTFQHSNYSTVNPFHHASSGAALLHFSDGVAKNWYSLMQENQ